MSYTKRVLAPFAALASLGAAFSSFSRIRGLRSLPVHSNLQDGH